MHRTKYGDIPAYADEIISSARPSDCSLLLEQDFSVRFCLSRRRLKRLCRARTLILANRLRMEARSKASPG